MVILLPLLVAKFKVLATLKYIPLAGIALLVTLILAAVTVPLNVDDPVVDNEPVIFTEPVNV
jgi:hypothetical protein